MKPLGFFWPSQSRDDLGVIGRLGRVFHWLGVPWFCSWAAASVFVGANPGIEANGWLAISFVVVAVLGYLSARGLRYILAGE